MYRVSLKPLEHPRRRRCLGFRLKTQFFYPSFSGRAAGLAKNLRQICQKKGHDWDYSRLVLVHIWSPNKSKTLMSSKSQIYNQSQNVLKLVFKSITFVWFGANLTRVRPPKTAVVRGVQGFLFGWIKGVLSSAYWCLCSSRRALGWGSLSLCVEVPGALFLSYYSNILFFPQTTWSMHK